MSERKQHVGLTIFVLITLSAGYGLHAQNVSFARTDSGGSIQKYVADGKPKGLAQKNYTGLIDDTDFNNDGTLDLVTINLSSDSPANAITIFLRDNKGVFQAGRNVAAGRNPVAISVGDFNGDGKPDVVTANRLSNDITVLLGGGDGSFQPGRNFSVGRNPSSIAVGDFNGDGKADVVTANRTSGDISVLLGDGIGGFQPARSFAAGAYPAAIVVGDFNSDKKMDIAVANAGSPPSFAGTVSVLLGNGDGNFFRQFTFDVGSRPNSIGIGDFDGNGKPDLEIVNLGSNNVSLLLNTTP